MNQLFETVTVKVGKKRRVKIIEVRGFIEDVEGLRVLLRTNEELPVTPAEKEIIQGCLNAVAFQLRKVKPKDDKPSEPTRQSNTNTIPACEIEMGRAPAISERAGRTHSAALQGAEQRANQRRPQ